MPRLIGYKQENQTFESWFDKMSEGDFMGVSWQWRNDKLRRVMNRLSKKGYFKRHSARGTDTYTRTSKAFIEGDSPNKPISYSKTIKNEAN